MTTTTYNLIAPATGKCMPIEVSLDTDLSRGMLGNGVAIIPTEDTVTAPFDCLVTSVSRLSTRSSFWIPPTILN